MPFSKTPELSTYQTKTISLVHTLDNRNETVSKDTDYLNCFLHTLKNRQTGDTDYSVVKRAGVETFAALSNTARGMYYWEDVQRIFVAFNNDIRIIDSTDGSIITTINAVFGTTSGKVGFCEFLYEDSTVKLVATDGSTLVTLTSGGTVDTCVDADLPDHLPIPIFLDGYLFLAEEDSADLYNSNLNDPLLWTAGDFISSEMFPDKILHIAKLNNYLLTFGSSSVEYFWDAAVESGSPLQRNDTPVKLYGYLGGFAQHGNKTYFIGNSSTSTPTLYRLEDFKLTEIETPSIRKYLEVLDVASEGIYGNIISFLGHDFYVLTINNSRCYIMDLETQLWSRIGYRQQSYFNIQYAINVKQTTDYCTVFSTSDRVSLLNFDPRVYQDEGSNFNVRIVTDNQMFDTYNQKVMYRLIVHADDPGATSNIILSWSDNDYQTFFNTRTINLNQELPVCRQLGRFRRRAFKMEYNDNYPLRIFKLEVDINKGQT